LIHSDLKTAELPVQDFNVTTKNEIIDFHYGHVDSSFFPFLLGERALLLA
jgi:hypothetical protein